MKYNDAESVMKDLEAEGHATVKLASRLDDDATDPATERSYGVSVRGPLTTDQRDRIDEIAGEQDATVSQHDHGNVRID